MPPSTLALPLALGLVFGAAASARAAAGEALPPGSLRSAELIYAEFCANCHGTRLEGGNGPTLIGSSGRLAGSDSALAEHILVGAPDAGMPAFSEALDPAEAQALVVFIREKANDRVIAERSQALPETPQPSALHSYRIERLLEGLDVPWSLAFLPDGSLLFTERVGQLFLMRQLDSPPIPIAGIPEARVRDEGGLMDVAVHPDYLRYGWIYLTFSDPGPGDTGMTKVVRGRIREERWTDEEIIFQGPPESYTASTRSYGSRLAFAGDYLFFTVGDRWDAEEAQDLRSPKGKVHRVFADGSIPADNPFAATPGLWPSIWSYGHRNLQGLAFHPATGALWTTEHGPRGGDELNAIEPGVNYGWPLATHGMNYDGTPISERAEVEGTRQPVRHWTPSIASSPVHFYAGDAFPQWKDSLFLGSLAQQQLFRFVVDDGRIIDEELVFKDLGRIRDIQTGPDGLLYLALELPGEPGYLIRLVPAEADGDTLAASVSPELP